MVTHRVCCSMAISSAFSQCVGRTFVTQCCHHLTRLDNGAEMAKHENNHYVPASYFPPWCDDGGRMTYFKLEGERFIANTTTPKSVAKEKLLYALHGAPTHLVTEMETDYFARVIDDPGAGLLRLLIEKGARALSTDQRHHWTRFVMALHLRRPEAIEHAREEGRRIVIKNFSDDAEYSALRSSEMPESMVDLIAPWVVDNFGMLTTPQIVDHEPTHEAIMGMHWWCQDLTSASHDLLTSDRPLFWPMGANDVNFYFSLPLTPRVCFFAAKQMHTVRDIQTSTPNVLVRRINESVVSQASEHVYSTDASQAAFVERRMRAKGSRAGVVANR